MSGKTFFVLESSLVQTTFDLLLEGKFGVKLRDCVSLVDLLRKENAVTEEEMYKNLKKKFEKQSEECQKDKEGSKDD